MLLKQNRDKGGLVKAMIYVNSDGTVARCFNSQRQDGGAGLPPSGKTGCGFSVRHPSSNQGFYFIDFGFQVNDRFLSATAQNATFVNITVTFDFTNGFPNEVFLSTNITDVDHVDSFAENPFMLIIY